MRITVKLGEPLWRLAGNRRIQLELPTSASLGDALALLEIQYPGLGARVAGTDPALLVPYNLFVNSRIVPADMQHAAPLNDGDTLFVFLPAAGG